MYCQYVILTHPNVCTISFHILPIQHIIVSRSWSSSIHGQQQIHNMLYIQCLAHTSSTTRDINRKTHLSRFLYWDHEIKRQSGSEVLLQIIWTQGVPSSPSLDTSISFSTIRESSTISWKKMYTIWRQSITTDH